MMNDFKILTFLLCYLLSSLAIAGDVNIIKAEFSKRGNQWSVNVTLKHNDTGWDHYADKWRVVDEKGNTLGERILFHPHVNEQPFTRGLGSVQISKDTTIVFIEAHDKVHGWAAKRYKVDLTELNKM